MVGKVLGPKLGLRLGYKVEIIVGTSEGLRLGRIDGNVLGPELGSRLG